MATIWVNTNHHATITYLLSWYPGTARWSHLHTRFSFYSADWYLLCERAVIACKKCNSWTKLSYALYRIVRDVSSRFFSLYITLKALRSDTYSTVCEDLRYPTFRQFSTPFQIVFKTLSTEARRKNSFYFNSAISVCAQTILKFYFLTLEN